MPLVLNVEHPYKGHSIYHMYKIQFCVHCIYVDVYQTYKIFQILVVGEAKMRREINPIQVEVTVISDLDCTFNNSVKCH